MLRSIALIVLVLQHNKKHLFKLCFTVIIIATWQ